jgi:hypothetical protein
VTGLLQRRSAELEYERFAKKTRVRTVPSTQIPLLEWHDSVLKQFVTTATAFVCGVAYMALNDRKTSIELHVGDPAPDFSLIGSDGRTYRLSELDGASAVVVAWFPKAFTGG